MRSPLVLYAILFALGILLADIWAAYPPSVILIISVVLTFAALTFHLLEGRLQRLSYLFLGLAVVGIGYARLQVSVPQSLLPEERIITHLKVLSSPDRTAKSWRVMAQVEDADYEASKVMLYFPQEITPPERGDRLVAYCRWQVPADSIGVEGFNYQRYLFYKGVTHTAYLREGSFEVVASKPGIVRRARTKVMAALRQSSLTPTQQGIAQAILMGYDADVSPATQQQFRSAGITHLLCVSGLHVGIVSSILGALLFLLPPCRGYRAIKGLLQVAGIWCFAIFTGLAPATLRAAIMFSILVLGRCVSAKPPTLNLLAASALLMLMVWPGLLFDIGFQLSYMAVLGIVVFYPPLRSLLRLPWGFRHLWEFIALSTVAQLASTPLLLYHFHQFAPYFLIANVTVVPLAGVLLGSCLLMIAVAWWPWALSLVSRFVGWQLQFIDWVTGSVASLPNAMIEGISFPAWALALSLLAIALAAFFVQRRANSSPLARTPDTTVVSQEL